MNEQYIGGNKVKISDFKKLNMIRNNESARAISSKLIYDTKSPQAGGWRGNILPEDSTLRRISDRTSINIEDSLNIFQVLPDVRTAMEIWTSCIISPKDFTSESLIWSIDDYNDYSAEMFNEMLNELKNYFENEYDILDMLKPAIEDALFKTGSYPLLIIPESTIDDIINGKSAVSNESELQKYFVKGVKGERILEGRGFLGNPPGPKNRVTQSLESRIFDNHSTPHTNTSIHPHLTITDNPDAVKLALALRTVRRKRARSRIRNAYGLEKIANEAWNGGVLKKDNNGGKSNEGIKKDNKSNDKDRVFDTKVQDKVAQDLYQTRAYDGQEIITLKSGKQASRLPIGHPLVMKLPSTSVIPVHVPGDPSDILGAFILLDENGNPLDTVNQSDFYQQARNGGGNDSNQVRNQAQLVIKQMSYYESGCCGCGDDRQTFDDLAKVYGSLLEQDLVSRLSAGVYGDQVEIAHQQEIYRVMLNRAIKQMNTQVLYCPIELLTYFAFDYNKYGIGKSILQDSKTLAALRSSMLYSDIFASIQNSIGRRKLAISLGEDELTPEKTIETIITEYNKVNSFSVPLMDASPADVVNTLREACMDIVVEGSNKVIPETQVNVEDIKTDRPQVDSEFRDNIRNLHIGGLGIPASIIDETQQSQFATTNLNANILFNKRVMNYQKIVSNRLVWDFVNKYTMNSGDLIRRLSLIIKDHKDQLTEEQRSSGQTFDIIEDFFDCLEISLPTPDALKIEDQQKDFDSMKGFLENIVDSVLPDSALEMILPESIRESSAGLKDVIKSKLISQYVEQNNFAPELFTFIDDESDSTKKVSSEVESYATPFAKAFVSMAFALDKVMKISNDPNLAKVAPEDGVDSSGLGDGGSTSDDSGSDEEGGEESGDDFNFEF